MPKSISLQSILRGISTGGLKPVVSPKIKAPRNTRGRPLPSYRKAVQEARAAKMPRGVKRMNPIKLPKVQPSNIMRIRKVAQDARNKGR